MVASPPPDHARPELRLLERRFGKLMEIGRMELPCALGKVIDQMLDWPMPPGEFRGARRVAA